MRFTFIAAKKAEHTVTILCRCLRVTRSGFYAWQRRPESTHARDDRRLKVLVRASFEESTHRYGSPRIHMALQRQGLACGRHRIARLMHGAGISGESPHRKGPLTTQPEAANPVAPNLLSQNFRAEQLNRKWAADITYVDTAEGWLYLAPVLDLCSR